MSEQSVACRGPGSHETEVHAALSRVQFLVLLTYIPAMGQLCTSIIHPLCSSFCGSHAYSCHGFREVQQRPHVGHWGRTSLYFRWCPRFPGGGMESLGEKQRPWDLMK